MKYLIPYTYGFATRVKTPFYKLSFLLVIVLPILFISMINDYSIGYVLPRFIIAFTAMYCVYENGYINNDTFTVQFEDKPTLRLNKKERNLVNRLSNILISVRLIYALICILILYLLDTKNLIIFIVMLVLLDFTYSLHNTYRNNFNIVTMFFLNVFKYGAIPVLFHSYKEFFLYLLVMTLVVPIVRAFEKIDKISNPEISRIDFDVFRIYYYLILTIIFIIMTIVYDKFLYGFILSAYFLGFRILSLVILRSKGIGDKILKIRKQASWKEE